jgi:uncharacterized protein DUF3106
LKGQSKTPLVLLVGLLLATGVPLSHPQAHHPGQNKVEPRRPPARPNRPAETQEERRSGQHAGAWLREHKNLSPDEQQRALENDPQFRKLPAERQEQLRKRLEHFSTLPPQQQDRILNRMDAWEHLTPEQRQQARGLAQQMRQLAPDRRRMMQTAIRNLRQMPPDQRQQVLDSPRFKSIFSPEEQVMLKGITQLPLAPAEPGQEGEPPK